MISRLLKNGASVLIAAKVLVISRLLHKKLSQRSKPPPYLESLRNRLLTLRRNLLARIDKRFKHLEVLGDGLLEAMCAFSLATSSSPTDVLRHFLYIREEAMSERSHKVGRNHESILQALQLYEETLKDTQALVPGQLARALERLKLIPLFKCTDLYSLLELNLDIHENWIGDDIKTFTPYIRQDDLQRSEAERLLKQWAKQAFASFLSGLRDCIQDVDDPLIIVRLRRQILELWFSNSRHAVGVDLIEGLAGLRDAFNSQFTRLIQSRVASLTEVTSIIQSTLHNWQIDAPDPTLSLWASSITSMETSGGANPLRKALLTTINGRTSSIIKISTQYRMWLSHISAIEATIRTLQSANWEDDLNDIDDNDELLAEWQTLLSSDDPGDLQQKLSDSLILAFRHLESSLKVPTSTTDEHDRGHVSAFLLRIFRELRQHLPPSYQNPDLGSDLIPKLHTILANAALTAPWHRCQERMWNSNVPGRQLWEGNPELPVLPSPWAFRILKDLVLSMIVFGTDIWSPSATAVLKQILREKLVSDLTEPLQSLPEINGHSTVETGGPTGEPKGANGISHPQSPPSIQNSNDVPVQRYFDTLYLIHATTPKNPHKSRKTQDSPSEKTFTELREGLKLNEESIKKIETSAEEYWKRTGMSFALMG